MTQARTLAMITACIATVSWRNLGVQLNRTLTLSRDGFGCTQSTVELASMAPGTMLCDYSLYVCTFLSIAVHSILHSPCIAHLPC